MKRTFTCILAIVLIFGIIGCGDPAKDAQKMLEDDYDLQFTTEDFLQTVVSGNLNTAGMFLKAGMDPNTLDEQGRPVILTAISLNLGEMVLLLVDFGADVKYTLPDSGINLLYYAAENNKTNCIKPLINNGVDLNYQDKDGYNSLDMAIRNENPAIIEMLQEAGLKPASH